jgi:hypothetical protein
LTSEKKSALFVLLALCCWILLTGIMSPGEKYYTPKSTVSLPGHSGLSSTTDSVKYLFVGIEKCASECHNNDKMGFQYNIIKDGPHAKSFQVLLSEKAKTLSVQAGISGAPVENSICLRCHITGSGLDSSFYASTYRKEDGVTCEACHKGPFRSKTYIPREADCLICHNNSVHKTPEFNYKENCAKIAHPRPKKL